MNWATLTAVGVALYLLWWSGHEDERQRRRRTEIRLQSEQHRLMIEMAMEFGFVATPEEFLEGWREYMSWRTQGRGLPYQEETKRPALLRRSLDKLGNFRLSIIGQRFER